MHTEVITKIVGNHEKFLQRLLLLVQLDTQPYSFDNHYTMGGDVFVVFVQSLLNIFYSVFFSFLINMALHQAPLSWK